MQQAKTSLYAIRKQHLGFILLEPIAAVWPPLYQMWLLLSLVLSLGVIPERRANSSWSPCSARIGHWNKAVSKGQVPAVDTSKEECFTLRCGRHGLQVTSTISCWSTGWWKWRKTDQQPQESVWRETGRKTPQFFQSTSVPVIAAGLWQRGICQSTIFTCIFHKLFGVSRNQSNISLDILPI